MQSAAQTVTIDDEIVITATDDSCVIAETASAITAD